ncbi:MAG TPA: hypothetical protein PLP29_19990 [Candidatus Ozemobacteraceae bacterium]|nr:hypothetical protein [Candidatus Ozemobacteraceae bacterium]
MASLLILAGVLMTGMPVVAAPPAGPDECMVIGEEVDTVKGTKLYMEAVSAWRQGLRQKALDQYEAALLADRGVLSRPDEGMAIALLERYRERVGAASPTVALLCRQGFFENIISGNLESAIVEYRKAASIASSEASKRAAGSEADRLQAQLEYLRTWQAEYRRTVALQRRRQDAEIAFQGRVEAVDDRIIQLEDERAELEERLAYLRRQESEGREELMTSIRRASRYRRAQYYPGRENQPDVPATSYAGPAVGPLPSPPPGAPGPLPTTTTTSPTPTPTAPTYQMPTEGSNLSLFYRNRNESLQNESTLYNIRAEITGVERRIEEIDKLIEKTRKERDELFNPPPAKKPAAVAPGPTPIRE